MKTPEAKFREFAKHFGKRSTWILAQGDDAWKQIEHMVPYIGRQNEKSRLRPMLVKAIFEFSSSKGFVLPDDLLTPSKQAPPTAKREPGGGLNPKKQYFDTTQPALLVFVLMQLRAR